MDGKPKRDAKGRVMKGSPPVNVTGKNAGTGFAPWRVRVHQLQAKYPTQEHLMKLFQRNATTGRMEPTKEFMQMNSIDAGIIYQLLGQVMGDDKRMERETFWDRHDGKAKENKQIRVINGMGDLSEEELEKLAGDE